MSGTPLARRPVGERVPAHSRAGFAGGGEDGRRGVDEVAEDEIRAEEAAVSEPVELACSSFAASGGSR